ncbi:MAG TPA: hypothetical protein PLB88_03605 [Thermoanaerobaculaceae bacterium]|nr:hypothetical protein [Thermoanaerobaculaceae bacterium]
MITDPVPRAAGRGRQYEASDAQHTLELPPARPLQQDAERLRAALEAAQAPGVRRVGQELLDHLAAFYGVPPPACGSSACGRTGCGTATSSPSSTATTRSRPASSGPGCARPSSAR